MSLVFRSSRWLSCMIAAIHVVAAIALLYLDYPWWMWLAMFVLLAMSCLHGVRRVDATRIRQLRAEEDGSFALERSGGASTVARVLPSTTDFGWAIWLHWRPVSNDSVEAVATKGAEMLLADQCSRDEWRRFRVWLRHRSAASLSDERGVA